MKRVIADRMAAVRDDTIVVFLIGMRVNRWWKVHRWWPVARAMPRMLTELAKDPASGFLGGTGALTRNGPMLVQYWESVEKLLAYAHDRAAQHLPAWAEFNRRVGTSGDVGVWHETFEVPRGGFEAIYVNMPPAGLGRVTRLEPARGGRARAADRLGRGGNAATGIGEA